MSKLCKANRAVSCAYKRNVKPHEACGFHGECIYQENVTMKSHGELLVNQLKEMNL